MPNKGEAIIWTYGGLIAWYIDAFLGLNEFRSTFKFIKQELTPHIYPWNANVNFRYVIFHQFCTKWTSQTSAISSCSNLWDVGSLVGHYCGWHTVSIPYNGRIYSNALSMPSNHFKILLRDAAMQVGILYKEIRLGQIIQGYSLGQLLLHKNTSIG